VPLFGLVRGYREHIHGALALSLKAHAHTNKAKGAMLTDFRKDMYSQYVTRFTASNLSSSPKIATAYHRWCDVKFKPFLDRLSKHSRIVELGCGPGHMLTYLLGQGFVNVDGIDISDEQIDIARRAGLPAQTEDAFAFLENTSQMFDAIIAIDFSSTSPSSKLVT